ncbi:MAG TPA: thiamine pyrophosphate-dependent enzyme [Patescibacteria group bacterium]
MNPADFNTTNTPTWCPGCGDFGMWASLKEALIKLGITPDSALVVYGIGCHGHMINFLKIYGFQGLHGRPLPVAAGVRLVNPDLNVFVVSGDGDCYGEGMGHFIAAARANYNLTLIVHNNQVYGLTTGQTAPTTDQGTKTKSTPLGVIDFPVNPIALAINCEANFVARGFAGDIPHLADLIVQANQHPGFSLVDVLQPCVTYDKVHTYPWYRERIYKLEDKSLPALTSRMTGRQGYDPTNFEQAILKAWEWPPKAGIDTATVDQIPIGVLFKQNRPTFESQLPQLDNGPLAGLNLTKTLIDDLIETFK